MKTQELEMHYRKSTKNTYVYDEALYGAIQTVYIRRSFLGAEPPLVIKVTIEEVVERPHAVEV